MVVVLTPTIYFITFAYYKEYVNNGETNQICPGECLHLDRDSDQRAWWPGKEEILWESETLTLLQP